MSLNDYLFTHRERTVEKYTLEDIKTAAKARLESVPLCEKALRSFLPQHRFTLVELNEIVDRVVEDSRYYSFSPLHRCYS